MASEAGIVDRSLDPDDTAATRLEEIARLPGVEAVVGLTDLHQGKQETPTSIVTVTRDRIYPELSSNVINCGMSVFRTGLTEDDLSADLVGEFCDRLDERAETYQPDREDIGGLLRRGAEYVCEEWSVDRAALDHIENGGSMFAPGEEPEDLTDLVPPWLFRYGGTYDDTPLPTLAGNHFLEFQVVDEVVDEETADEWGLYEGGVVVMLHGDFTLTSIVNWHYANRLKFRERIPLGDRVKLQSSKALFHLLRDGPLAFPANWRRYDNRDRYTEFDVDAPEGRHLASVVHAAMNFGYANRFLASLCIADCLGAVAPDAGDAELLWDVGHDTIQRETFDGEEFWLHRKGAAKAVPGKPAIVSGSYNMRSLLGKGGTEATATYRSYDHGCSRVIETLEPLKEDGTGRSTLRFDRGSCAVEDEFPHVDPEPIETVVRDLSDDGVVSEVVWLRPFANIGE